MAWRARSQDATQRRFGFASCRRGGTIEVDYAHWNPKKHGHVASVRDWRWSSFHRFVELGEYTPDWGAEDPAPGYDDPEWGE
jgi:hypothetical protein